MGSPNHITIGVVRKTTPRTLRRGMRFVVGPVERSSNDSGVQTQILPECEYEFKQCMMYFRYDRPLEPNSSRASGFGPIFQAGFSA
jgi:hypothetical protein